MTIHHGRSNRFTSADGTQRRKLLRAATAAVALAATVAACSSGSSGGSGGGAAHTEINPAGDIPDDQAFVSYAPSGTEFSIEIPEGWSAATSGPDARFTDKYNTVLIHLADAASAPTEATVAADDLPALRSSVPTLANPVVSTVRRRAGDAVLLTYTAESAVNDVTGKVTALAVEQYRFWRAGRLATITLSAPTGSDNVDPWRTITDSFSWSS